MDRLDPQTPDPTYPADPAYPTDSTYPTRTGTADPTVHGGQDGGETPAFAGAAPFEPGTSRFDPWSYRDEAGVTGANLVGYKLEATDGDIGKVDSSSHEVNASYLVVDTGPWIFGKKVMIPAGVVNHVDHDERKVYVDRSKDQIKAAPEYDENNHGDPGYRDKLSGYYGDTYGLPPGAVIPPPRMTQ